MNGLEARPWANATSAAGAMVSLQVRRPVLVGIILAGLGTSTAQALPADGGLRSQRTAYQTSAGTSVDVALRSATAIGELRRLSGLTWDQLARLFNVSRRSLHFWASGKPMAPSNEEHLQRVLAVMRVVDHGSATTNRTLLLGAGENGDLPIDLLAAGNFDEVVSLLGSSEAHRYSRPNVTRVTRMPRSSASPDELVDALQDRIHRDGGKTRAAKSVRFRNGG